MDTSTTFLGALDLSRPGTPGDLWSWVEVLVEELVLPHLPIGLVPSQESPRSVPLAVRFCERLVSPDLAAAWEEVTSPSASPLWGEITRSVSREFGERFGCVPQMPSLGGDTFQGFFYNTCVPWVMLPPGEFLVDRETIELYTLLRRSVMPERLAREVLASFLVHSSQEQDAIRRLLKDGVAVRDIRKVLPGYMLLPPSQQETCRTLLRDELSPRDALTIAGLV